MKITKQQLRKIIHEMVNDTMSDESHAIYDHGSDTIDAALYSLTDALNGVIVTVIENGGDESIADEIISDHLTSWRGDAAIIGP